MLVFGYESSDGRRFAGQNQIQVLLCDFRSHGRTSFAIFSSISSKIQGMPWVWRMS
jgi:hypothetical protein